MQVTELALRVGLASGGLEPALEDGGGAGPFRPIAVGGVGGLDERAQGAASEEAFDRGGVLGPDGGDELLAFARLHRQVL